MSATQRPIDLQHKRDWKKQRLEEGVDITVGSLGSDYSPGYKARGSPFGDGKHFAESLDEAGLQENETENQVATTSPVTEEVKLAPTRKLSVGEETTVNPISAVGISNALPAKCKTSKSDEKVTFSLKIDESGEGFIKQSTDVRDRRNVKPGKTLPVGEREKVLMDENARLKRMQNCINCGERKRTALQIPCKCLMLCMVCAEFEEVCPEGGCRSNIVDIFEVKW